MRLNARARHPESVCPPLWRRAVAAVAAMVVLLGLAIDVAGQEAARPTPASAAVPAYRQADSVVVITVTGEINSVTELSVKRRIAYAERAGADAIVFDIDSPGGELGAVLEISNAIKASTIPNTVAWINPDAYSGGAIIALACSEIVVADPSSMGDAFPITASFEGVRGLNADERTKFLPPLLSDVADSARRNGYDEYLVQAIVVDGIELWGVQDETTGSWIFINESEYRTLFEGDPPRGKPILTSVPNGRAAGMTSTRGDRDASRDEQPGDSDEQPEAEPAESAADGSDATDASTADPAEPAPSNTGSLAEAPEDVVFRPASDAVADLTGMVTDGLEVESKRPVFTEADRGRYTSAVYMCDGTGPIVLRDDQMLQFGIAAATIQNDQELKQFFGATSMTRLDRNWSEHLVAFLTNGAVRAVLIAVFLIAMFIEMSSPGLALPGGVALIALAALLAPPALIGAAGWWEFVAIGVGFALILVEAFVLPGFGVFGILGLVSLFVGLVGTFIPDGPVGPGAGGDVAYAAAMVMLALFASAVAFYFIAKHFGSVPFLNRLVLAEGVTVTERTADDDALAAIGPSDPHAPIAGDIGTARTDLRPSGLVDYGDRAVEAVADYGMIEAGTRVRFIGRRGFEWAVEPVTDDDSGTEA